MNGYPRALAEFPCLLAHPRQSRSAILRSQSRALRRLIRHAFKNVPYYRQLLGRQGITPDDIRTPEDLRKIPFTSKSDLRSRPLSDILDARAKPRRLRMSRTSGSTGEPFSVWRSDGEEFFLDVFRRRVMTDFGLKAGDRMARVMAHPARPTRLWRLARACGMFRQDFVSLALDPAVIAEKIRILDPDVLTGNTGVLTQVARVGAANTFSGLRLKFVVCGSEVGTPAMKRQIETGFQAPVFDVYAAHEFGTIAWECRGTGLYHVHDDSLILEVLDKDGEPVPAGEEGEAVVTSLPLRTMPFIRFKLGDRLIVGPAPCPCGAPFSTVAAIAGRMTDYLILPDGRRLYARTIDLVIREHAPWIAQFELVQETLRNVVLRAVPLSSENFTTDVIAAKIKMLLGPNVEFRIEVVDAIRPTARGKFAYLRSNVASEYKTGAGNPEL